MQITIGKLASLLIAVIRFVGAIVVGGFDARLIRTAMTLLIVLSLIWFSDEIGESTNTPGVILAGFGWFFLVGMPLLVLLVNS